MERRAAFKMAKRENVSISVIRRMPRYYRFLNDLLSAGITRISSMELSRRMGLTASQIRQDLNCFGDFGQQGYGYNVEQLRDNVGAILGLENKYPIILIGAGNIGRAIAANMDFCSLGFKLTGIFDVNPAVIGSEIAGLTVRQMDELDEYCTNNATKTAILTVPLQAAPQVVEKLVGLGVMSYWNFTHFDVARNFEGTVVENVHLSDSLMTLCYHIKHAEEIKAVNP